MTAHRISIAPMMGWTDRHARYFLRLITRHSLLYTEMITTGALLHGPRERLLKYHAAEHPLAIQLGGSDPAELADCARLADAAGFDEINLNVGCPSDRVQSGAFGACLMAEPALVRDCVAAMLAVTTKPVTVKCRIGIDDMTGYAPFRAFIDSVADSGCTRFIVHARKAWLKGLSPKENRDVPPLEYEHVYRLKRERPELTVILNGGVRTLEEVDAHLAQVDGVMLGREAYHNPYLLAGVDARYYGEHDVPMPRDEVIEHLIRYADAELQQGVRLHDISRHVLGLYQGRNGARAWRRKLSTRVHEADARSNLLRFGD
jgi:tRNA-dihydrouridine synthase A